MVERTEVENLFAIERESQMAVVISSTPDLSQTDVGIDRVDYVTAYKQLTFKS